MKTKVIQNDPDGAAITGAPPPAAVPAIRPRRRALVVAGALTAALGAGALAGGAALVAVHETQRDAAGFYAAETGALATPTRAMVSPDLDVGDAGPGWLLAEGRLGRVRVAATGARDGPVFVGIARRADVNAYLAGVPHALADFDGRHAAASTVAGTGAPAPPASQKFWEKSAAGAGTQTVVWPVQKGDWSAVVMNTDGSAGVRATTRVSVATDVVLWLGVGMLLAGVALAGAGTALMLAGRARAPA